ncbi:MAG: TnpV protein [Clostridium sp.]|nr:TnpV protein [Clostridium sp.]MCM1550049.1 TnpV protein [Clostridium sp.]
MLYPDLTLPEGKISMTNLGRFAIKAAEYLRENHRERYMMLMRFGKLGEKMQEVEEEANRMLEILEMDYLKKNKPENPNSTMELWSLREQAKMQAEEIVLTEIVMKFH